VAISSSSSADIEILNLAVLDESSQDLLDGLPAELLVAAQIELPQHGEGAYRGDKGSVGLTRNAQLTQSQGFDRMGAPVGQQREEMVEVVLRQMVVRDVYGSQVGAAGENALEELPNVARPAVSYTLAQLQVLQSSHRAKGLCQSALGGLRVNSAVREVKAPVLAALRSEKGNKRSRTAEGVLTQSQGLDAAVFDEPAGDPLEILVVQGTLAEVELLDPVVALQARQEEADGLLAGQARHVQLDGRLLVDRSDDFADHFHQVSLALLKLKDFILKLHLALGVLVL